MSAVVPLFGQHKENKYEEMQVVDGVSMVGNGKDPLADDGGYVVPCMTDIVCTENNPSYGGEYEGE